MPQPLDANLPPGAGWTRRFCASRARLHEAASLYRELGFDVYIGPGTPDPDAQCDQCVAEVRSADGTLYTRPGVSQEKQDRETPEP